MIFVTGSVIDDTTPLQGNYIPSEFINREEAQAFLDSTFSEVTAAGTQNIVITGPRGTGKTHIIRKQLRELPTTVTTCYVNCRQNNTQYKALSNIYRTLFDEDIGDGLHTATLQQELEHRLTGETLLVLDDLDFLLLNNGDDLLYYLSRRLSPEITLVLITANDGTLESRLEERTYSSLNPQRLGLVPYTIEEQFDILAARARHALTPQSLHRQALRYIATTISNPRVGLHWLQTAGEATTDAITEPVVKRVQSQAYQRYVDAQLDTFTPHHQLLYRAIQDLTIAQETSIRTGQIYDRYERLCERAEQQALSHRRISDFLKHLELLNLINVNYYYGGEHGRTREIQLHPNATDQTDE